MSAKLIDDVRRTLAGRDDDCARQALGSLAKLEQELADARRSDARLRQFADALIALDLSKTGGSQASGAAIDDAASCLQMIAMDLAAYIAERAAVEQSLEQRVRERTEQLVQAGKMAAIGQLAAGIAHELNNPLAVILAFAHGMQRRLPDVAPQLSRPVVAITREAQRCRELVAQLLTFARTGARNSREVDLRHVLENTRTLLHSRAVTQDTELQLDLPGEALQVMGDRCQLEQVVINLGINALDARSREGRVEISAARDGESHVVIRVRDNGPGIPEAVKARMFEPFFTTKEVGKGTGLGLSLSFEIVQQHGGTLHVDSQLGRGTTMVVRLPVWAPS